MPATSEAVADLVAWARDSHVARLRIEPEAPAAFGDLLRVAGWSPAPAADPENTLLVPLRDPDEMLAGFHQKHRYNIRLAQRRGVTVEVGQDVAELHRQHAVTAARQHIAPPSLAAYQRRLDHLAWCRVYVARVEGEAVAASMVVRFGNRAVYLFGGSTGAHSKLQPTYAVQWAAMQDAWRAGCAVYDLWGVPPSDDPSHPWHGLWQFKMGFRGEFVTYAGAWELPVGAWRAGLSRRLASLPRPRLPH